MGKGFEGAGADAAENEAVKQDTGQPEADFTNLLQAVGISPALADTPVAGPDQTAGRVTESSGAAAADEGSGLQRFLHGMQDGANRSPGILGAAFAKTQQLLSGDVPISPAVQRQLEELSLSTALPSLAVAKGLMHNESVAGVVKHTVDGAKNIAAGGDQLSSEMYERFRSTSEALDKSLQSIHGIFEGFARDQERGLKPGLAAGKDTLTQLIQNAYSLGGTEAAQHVVDRLNLDNLNSDYRVSIDVKDAGAQVNVIKGRGDGIVIPGASYYVPSKPKDDTDD